MHKVQTKEQRRKTKGIKQQQLIALRHGKRDQLLSYLNKMKLLEEEAEQIVSIGIKQ